MDRAPRKHLPPQTAEVIDFDAALLASYPQAISQALIAEAELLAQAFAPEGRSAELEAMALSLLRETAEGDADRRRARGLAAALRILAKRS